jgi:hypothetical protein
VVGKIIHLRENSHFGPTKISMYLKLYHDVAVSSSRVWRIIKRLGLNRLPASQRYVRKDRRWKRYEKQQPGHRVQIDVKFIIVAVAGVTLRHTRLASDNTGRSVLGVAASVLRSPVLR